MDLCTDISRECCNCDQGQASGCPCGQSGCPSCCQSHCTDMIHYPVTMAFVPWQQWQPTYEPGCLEQQHPVAMAYVPWQQWQTTYAPERGLVQGTIFPELDLPFHCGRCGI